MKLLSFEIRAPSAIPGYDTYELTVEQTCEQPHTHVEIKSVILELTAEQAKTLFMLIKKLTELED
jgi:hypothetical protein